MKLILSAIATFLLLLNDVEASHEEKEGASLQTLHRNYFQNIPDEMIVKIGSYLYEDDFTSFVFSSTHTKSIIMNYESFFISKDKEQVAKIITDTSITNVPDLILDWGRSKKKSILTLREVLLSFEGYPTKPQEDLELERKKFKNYVKVINILYGLGDKDSGEKYKASYRVIQDLLCDERAEDDKLFYIFNLKNFSLLVPETREEIANNYQEGKWPFEKNNEKSIKYSKALNLPLSPNIFSNG